MVRGGAHGRARARHAPRRQNRGNHGRSHGPPQSQSAQSLVKVLLGRARTHLLGHSTGQHWHSREDQRGHSKPVRPQACERIWGTWAGRGGVQGRRVRSTGKASAKYREVRSPIRVPPGGRPLASQPASQPSRSRVKLESTVPCREMGYSVARGQQSRMKESTVPCR